MVTALTKSLISLLMTEGSWKAIPNQLVGAGLAGVVVVLVDSNWVRFRLVGVDWFWRAVTVGSLLTPMCIILVDRVVMLGRNWRPREYRNEDLEEE